MGRKPGCGAEEGTEGKGKEEAEGQEGPRKVREVIAEDGLQYCSPWGFVCPSVSGSLCVVTGKGVLSGVFASRGGRVVACRRARVGKKDAHSKAAISALKKKQNHLPSDKPRK